ncbi:MAG: hypothetical protein E6Q97_34050, partial [Desulfurellales bacterium]
MRAQTGSGNPIMIIPLLAILAWLDIQSNQGRTVAMLGGLYRSALAIDLWPIAKQLIVVAIAGAFAVVAFKLARQSASVKAFQVAKVAGHKITRMPSTMPRRLTATVADVLSVRGGVDANGLPLFWLDGKASTVTPLAWTLAVDYANGVEPDKLSRFVPDIENRLYGAGYDVQVRVKDRPLALEIDNPQPPLFALRDWWKGIQAMPQNERLCAPAVEPTAKGMQLVSLPLRNMGAATFVVGMPGAGKTQFILSSVLSLCMANSPQRMSLIVADVKAADTMPLSGLPHMACPVVTDIEQIATMLDALCAEMEQRSLRSAAGDRTWLQHSICVVVDEVAELVLGGKHGDSIANTLQRLTQRGRGLGIILIMATQRVYDVPAKVYTKIDRRCVFRVASASDSVAASGSEGTRCNKLPKRGALEIFSAGDPTAQRAQGLFVADAESPDYESVLSGFIDDIKARWGCMAPGWHYAPVPKAEAPTQVPGDAVVEPGKVHALAAKFGNEFVHPLVDLGDEGNLSAKAVEKTYQQM